MVHRYRFMIAMIEFANIVELLVNDYVYAFKKRLFWTNSEFILKQQR